MTLNSRNAPPLIISDDYKMMLKEYERGKKQDKSQKEAVFFIKQKIDAAKWFIEMIQQRQQTLLKTMKAILSHQQSFFTLGNASFLTHHLMDFRKAPVLEQKIISSEKPHRKIIEYLKRLRQDYFHSQVKNTHNHTFEK